LEFCTVYYFNEVVESLHFSCITDIYYVRFYLLWLNAELVLIYLHALVTKSFSEFDVDV